MQVVEGPYAEFGFATPRPAATTTKKSERILPDQSKGDLGLAHLKILKDALLVFIYVWHPSHTQRHYRTLSIAHYANKVILGQVYP